MAEHLELLDLRRLDDMNMTNITNTEDEISNTELLVSSLRVYGSFFILAFPVYCVVRLWIPRTYAVRQWVEKIKNPLAADQFGFISWVWKVYYFSAEELLENTALDAVCFLRLMRMGLRMAIVGCFNSLWLFPTYATAPQTKIETDVFNKVSINILLPGSQRFLATVLASYVFYGYAFYTILKEFHWFIDKRHLWLQNFNQRNFTVFVRNIPKEMRSNVVLKDHFQLLYGEDSVVDAHIILHTSDLEASVTKRETVVGNLEHALAELAVFEKRPTHRVVKGMNSVDSINYYSEELEKLNADITARIDAIEKRNRPTMPKKNDIIQESSLNSSRDCLGDDELVANPDPRDEPEELDETEERALIEKPARALSSVSGSSGVMSRVGKFKLQNAASTISATPAGIVNAVDKLTMQGVMSSKQAAKHVKSRAKKQAAKRKKQARHLLEKAESVTDSVMRTGEEGTPDDAAFVTFRSLVAVHSALQMSHHHRPFVLDVYTAPDRPDFLLWANVGKDKEAVQTGVLISAVATFALCLFWTVPVAAITNLTNVQTLKEHYPSLEEKLEDNEWIVGALAVLSPLLLLIFNTGLLPIILKFVSRLEFPPSDSLLEASAFWKMAAFNIIQTFFVSLISGSLVQEIENIAANPRQIIQFLAEALPERSAFFMQLLIVSTCVGTLIELFRTVPIIQSILRRFMGRKLTEKERQSNAGPFKPLSCVDKFYYSRTQARFLLYFMVMFVYSAISPLINWFSVLFFLLLGSAFRYQLVYNYPSTPDSGGEIWLYFIKVILACIVIAQISLAGFLASKEATSALACMIPLLVCTILFIIYLHQRHFTIGKYLPARTALRKDVENDDDEVDHDSFKNNYKNPALMIRHLEPDWDSGKAESMLRRGFGSSLDEESPTTNANYASGIPEESGNHEAEEEAQDTTEPPKAADDAINEKSTEPSACQVS